jgi:site-specific DNA-methyltransferase (cytosine-N4-specific)
MTSPSSGNAPYIADARDLPWDDSTVDCVVTSPPYWGQRDYGFDGQIGIEPTWPEYVEALLIVGREIRRVLRPTGTLWLNLGDTFNTRTVIRPSAHQAGLGHDTESTRLSWAEARDAGLVRYSARQPGMQDKDLMLLPFRVAAALQEDGWVLRADVIWSKPFGSPENAPDRPSRTHEYVFMLTPSAKGYPFDKAGPAARSVWEISPEATPGHGTGFPDELVRRCIEASTSPGDVVGDPFGGSGRVARVAESLGRMGITSDGREWSDVR